MALIAAGARSTNTAAAAPRESASMPERARSGEEVEHARAVDGRAEHAEQRLAHAVARRAGRVARRRDQPPPAVGARDDPHGVPRSGGGSIRSPVGCADGSTPLTPAAAEAARRRTPPPARRRAARARAARAPGRLEERLGVDARGLDELDVLGQARELKLREPRLARAGDLALAAQLEVDVRELEAVASCPRRRAAARDCLGPNSRQTDACSPRPMRPRSWCSWLMPKRSAPSTSMTVAFGTSTPTSMTVVATSTSAVARGERRHRLLLLARAHLAVQQRDPVVGELAAAQPLVLDGRRARRQRLGLLDQRADDERLAARVELLADALVRARPLAVGRRDVRRDRAPALAAARAAR